MLRAMITLAMIMSMVILPWYTLLISLVISVLGVCKGYVSVSVDTVQRDKAMIGTIDRGSLDQEKSVNPYKFQAMVPITVQGKPLRALFDTGATLTLIQEKMANDIKPHYQTGPLLE